MNQDAPDAQPSNEPTKKPDDAADDGIIDGEPDESEATVDPREGSGDLDALAAMTRSDTFDAQDLAATTAAQPTGASRPRPTAKPSGLKAAAVFPVMTVGLVLIGFAIYGLMILNGSIERADGDSVMPKIMAFVAGPLGLIMELIGVGLLISVIDDNKKAKAQSATKAPR